MSDDKDPDDKKSDNSGSDNGKKKPPRKPDLKVVVDIPEKRELVDKHVEHLAASGITRDWMTRAELYTEHVNSKIAKLMDMRHWARIHGAALVFPFYFPGESKPYGYRIRPTQPRVVGKRRDGSPKHAKYDQASSAGLMVYYPPGARTSGTYRDAAHTLYWTEGEKKALVLDQLGYTVIGLTGVWNWIDTPHREETGAERLHERIRDHATIGGRHHVIVFDGDARSNDQVMLAAGRLAGVLVAAGAASVKFICPTSKEHKGIDDYFVAHGEEITRQLLASAETIEPLSPKDPLTKLVSIKALRDAPIESNLRMPTGYEVEKDGSLWALARDDKHSDTKVARGPILIQRYLDDYYSGEGRVEVCFERDGRWMSATVTRKAIVDSRTMVTELSPFGAPCTCNNAAKFVDWLDDLERVNAGRIPRIACVARAGWHDIDGQRVFVLDEPLDAANGEDLKLVIDTRGDRKKIFGALRSIAADKPDEEQQRLQQGHVAALKRAWEADPVAAALIAGSLAAPLLELLGAPNFGIHLPGDSSRGKTSMLKIAGSVYGNANSEQWLANWNITPVGAELRATTLCDLPQLYDEAGSGDQETIDRLIYMLINGGGRARGNITLQLRETPSWRTIVLSTGERSIADESAATGAQIRIIHLPVTKFGELGAEGVDNLREACVAHAGVFGRAWIEMLLDLEDPSQALTKVYRRCVDELRALAGDDPLKGRLASYFAVLCVAEILSSTLGLGDPQAATMKALFAEDGGRREEVRSLAERALDAVKDWLASEPDAFPVLRTASNGEEQPEKKGAKILHGYQRQGQLLLIPGQFRKWCEGQRLSPREVIRGWKERGLLDHNPKRLDKQIRIGDTKAKLYVLSAHALDDELLGFTPPPEESALPDDDENEGS